jgi:hypothetical protein
MKWATEWMRRFWAWLVNPRQPELRVFQAEDEGLQLVYPAHTNGHAIQTADGHFERTLDEVVLKTAYYWECPACGAGYYEQSVPMELTPDERKEISLALDGLDVSQVPFTSPPETVTCGECGREFAAVESDDE